MFFRDHIQKVNSCLIGNLSPKLNERGSFCGCHKLNLAWVYSAFALVSTPKLLRAKWAPWVWGQVGASSPALSHWPLDPVVLPATPCLLDCGLNGVSVSLAKSPLGSWVASETCPGVLCSGVSSSKSGFRRSTPLPVIFFLFSFKKIFPFLKTARIGTNQSHLLCRYVGSFQTAARAIFHLKIF